MTISCNNPPLQVHIQAIHTLVLNLRTKQLHILHPCALDSQEVRMSNTTCDKGFRNGLNCHKKTSTHIVRLQVCRLHRNTKWHKANYIQVL